MGTASKIPFCCTLMSPNMREKSREYDPTLLPVAFCYGRFFFLYSTCVSNCSLEPSIFCVALAHRSALRQCGPGRLIKGTSFRKLCRFHLTSNHFSPTLKQSEETLEHVRTGRYAWIFVDLCGYLWIFVDIASSLIYMLVGLTKLSTAVQDWALVRTSMPIFSNMRILRRALESKIITVGCTVKVICCARHTISNLMSNKDR